MQCSASRPKISSGTPAGPDRGVRLGNLLTPNKFIPIHLERKNVVAGLPPVAVELHLTSLCNYRCRHCSYSLRNQQRASVPGPVIENLITSLSATSRPRSVYFSGGGEPTTLPHWDEYVIRLADAGVQVALITNGSLLRESHLPALRRLGYLAVSIYSPDPATYVSITGGNAFAAQTAIPALLGPDFPGVVGARCVINSENHASVDRIYSMAMQAGYDYIIFIPEVDYERRGITLSSAEVDTLMHLCAGMDIDSDKTNLYSLLVRSFGYYEARSTREIGDRCLATAQRTNAFVNYDGGVYLCQPHIGSHTYRIGNVIDAPWAAIWNSQRHEQVITALQEAWRAGECVNCRSIAFARAVAEYGALPANTPFTIVKDSFI